ncbi:MAG: hypothetical protein IJP54_05680 [Synergistaceae bacterium]|nr:hypothetical protein [Synergistaceae bacterium]
MHLYGTFRRTRLFQTECLSGEHIPPEGVIRMDRIRRAAMNLVRLYSWAVKY